jgi:hypothetical protein
MRMREIVARRTVAGMAAARALGAPEDAATFGVRQRRRSAARKAAFESVNLKYGPEPRPNRRRMALNITRRSLGDAFGK